MELNTEPLVSTFGKPFPLQKLGNQSMPFELSLLARQDHAVAYRTFFQLLIEATSKPQDQGGSSQVSLGPGALKQCYDYLSSFGYNFLHMSLFHAHQHYLVLDKLGYEWVPSAFFL